MVMEWQLPTQEIVQIHHYHKGFTSQGSLTVKWFNRTIPTPLFADNHVHSTMSDYHCIRQMIAASIEAITSIWGVKSWHALGPCLLQQTRGNDHQLLPTNPWTNFQCMLHWHWNSVRAHFQWPQNPLFQVGTELQDFSPLGHGVHHRGLGRIMSIAPWLQFFWPDTYTSISQCLCLHHNHLSITNKQFHDLFKHQKNKQAPDVNRSFAMICVIRATNQLSQNHSILKEFWKEFALTWDVLRDDTTSW